MFVWMLFEPRCPLHPSRAVRLMVICDRGRLCPSVGRYWRCCSRLHASDAESAWKRVRSLRLTRLPPASRRLELKSHGRGLTCKGRHRPRIVRRCAHAPFFGAMRSASVADVRQGARTWPQTQHSRPERVSTGRPALSFKVGAQLYGWFVPSAFLGRCLYQARMQGATNEALRPPGQALPFHADLAEVGTAFLISECLSDFSIVERLVDDGLGVHGLERFYVLNLVLSTRHNDTQQTYLLSK